MECIDYVEIMAEIIVENGGTQNNFTWKFFTVKKIASCFLV